MTYLYLKSTICVIVSAIVISVELDESSCSEHPGTPWYISSYLRIYLSSLMLCVALRAGMQDRAEMVDFNRGWVLWSGLTCLSRADRAKAPARMGFACNEAQRRILHISSIVGAFVGASAGAKCSPFCRLKELEYGQQGGRRRRENQTKWSEQKPSASPWLRQSIVMWKAIHEEFWYFLCGTVSFSKSLSSLLADALEASVCLAYTIFRRREKFVAILCPQ